MLLKLLTSGRLRQLIVISILTMVLWGGAFSGLKPASSFKGFLLQTWLLGDLLASPFASTLLSFCLIIAQAILINYLLRSQRYVPLRSSLPAFLFIALYSHTPAILPLHPVSLPGFLLFLSFVLTFHLPGQPWVIYRIYLASLMTGFALIMYPLAGVFLIYIWIVLVANGIFRWREWLVSILGFLNPVLILSVILFYFDVPQGELLVDSLSTLRLPYVQNFPGIVEILFIVSMSLISLVSLFMLFSARMSKPVSFRTQTWLLIWFLLISLLSTIISGRMLMFHLALVTIPLVALLAAFFSEHKRSLRSELVMGFVLILILLENFQILT